ncbi:MAG: methyl-accepting chemotaxis protein [Sulfurimonas sp.]|jgi:methyl-accepting chemotaxis protein|uniref:hypothetical protein n=1 Tax=Sulfurimonas sp. TaxID=2022749 RepID=UPI0039E4BEE1
MGEIQIITKVIFSIAIAYLATSIILFTIEVGKNRQAIPEILNSLEKLENAANINSILKSVDTTTQEITMVRKEIPNILYELQKIRKLTPLILEQVDNTNKNIPKILEEIKQTRKTVPLVLTESKKIRKIMLNESKKIRETLPSILNEAKKIRETVPTILKHSEEIRKELPEQITRIEKIVDNVDQISKDATQGVVTGTVTGILSLPGELIKETGKALMDEETDESFFDEE